MGEDEGRNNEEEGLVKPRRGDGRRRIMGGSKWRWLVEMEKGHQKRK